MFDQAQAQAEVESVLGLLMIVLSAVRQVLVY